MDAVLPAPRTGRKTRVDPATGQFIQTVDIDVAALVERYKRGESIQDLARACGMTDEGLRKRIKHWALAGRGDKSYEELVTDVLVMRVAEADELLESAIDPVGVARAREIARFARMDLERRRPHLYGNRMEVQHVGPASLLLGIEDQSESHS